MNRTNSLDPYNGHEAAVTYVGQVVLPRKGILTNKGRSRSTRAGTIQKPTKPNTSDPISDIYSDLKKSKRTFSLKSRKSRKEKSGLSSSNQINTTKAAATAVNLATRHTSIKSMYSFNDLKYEKKDKDHKDHHKDPASKTYSSVTTSTVVSVQPQGLAGHHDNLNLHKIGVERSNTNVGRRPTIDQGLFGQENTYPNGTMTLGRHRMSTHVGVNSYKQPVRLTPSIRKTVAAPTGVDLGAGAASTSPTGPVMSDPSHPAHHNNVFETLHSPHLSHTEKTNRLLSLLKKSQAKQRHWSTGLCNCTTNKSTSRHFLYQCLLGPIYQGCQAERMGEDFFTGCCMGSLAGLPCTALPWISNGAMISLRTKIRERHNILGAIFEDWLVYICCLGNCASVQLYNELDELGYPPAWLG